MLVDQSTVLLLKDVIQKEGKIRLPASGSSMYPFIQQGDMCQFVYVQQHEWKKGDILLFFSESLRLVAHRYYGKHHDKLLFKGDSNLGFDPPIKPEQVIGKLSVIEKKGKHIEINVAAAQLWKNIILYFPMISSMLRFFINHRNI
ncbi:S24/S26 family peptidase [Falsibacillus albus]|uniref:Signal peptidase I n=1 Tax=Falsibacillus albus TaxID=2478915 RepID=A0A3L7K2Q9_9BACI|nr:hypothetical protein [Falsibacillus albus]RLQ96271.1 hypothetical protein D9X91_08270 [Falsibacillus albus]